jgi:hypothetical protein
MKLTCIVHRRIIERYQAGVLIDRKSVQKRQIANTGSLLETLQNYGALVTTIPSMIWGGTTAPLTAEPKGLVPEIQISKGVKFVGSKRVKIRYGPFRVPSTQEKNFNLLMWNVEGTATSFHMNVRRPCEDECMILGIQADLEYADGSAANVTNGVS